MATWLSGISKQHRIIRHNVFIWFGLFMLAFVVIILRMFEMQVIHRHFYRDMADALHTRTIALHAERGQILDRNSAVLALDKVRQTLFADPSLVQYPEFVATQLAPILQMSREDLLVKLNAHPAYVELQADVSAQRAEAIRAAYFPAVQVRPNGLRFHIGVDALLLPHSTGVAEDLATALDIPVRQLNAELGDLSQSDSDSTPPNAVSNDVRWLKGTFAESRKSAVEALHFTGIRFTQAETNYQVGVNPQVYLQKSPPASPENVAIRLAPLLAKKPAEVKRLLLYIPRFVILKRDLSEVEVNAVAQLQGSMFVTEPGKVYAAPSDQSEAATQVDKTVKRLVSLMNEKGKAITITPDAIRDHLALGAAPGILGVRLGKDGKPLPAILNNIYAYPIPGVMYGIPGISFMQEPERYYPYKSLASPMLGWVGDVRVHPHGSFGLEAKEDGQLTGIDGSEVHEVDGHLNNRLIPEFTHRIDPISGHDLMTTLDLTIQQAAEDELAIAVAAAKAKRGECLVEDIHTGELLAMATYPGWDANAPGKSAIPLVNPVSSNFYEPGSTYKVLTVMAALEEGVIKDGQTVTVCHGSMQIGKRTIGEHNRTAHGAVDCGRLLEQSCNIGAATLAFKLGPERFMSWCEKAGFGHKTGIELAHESSGALNKKNMHARITLANMGFGQSIAVTPLQMIAMYSAVANGGEWLQPHLIKSIQAPDGITWQTPPTPPHHPLCSAATAALIRGYLERVVLSGTGKKGQIVSYRAGGKTGTAQKAGKHGYDPGKYVGSFIGIAPIENPQLAIIVLIDEPTTTHYGAEVAAPAFSAIARRSLQYLNVPPSAPLPGASATQHH